MSRILSFFWPSALATLLVLGSQFPAVAQDDHPLAKMPLRLIGPALTSGRVADFAFHPQAPQIHYVAMASGGLWKTVNNGTTWTPIFDDQASFALGVVELDPTNPNVVWVGSGENNNQRSVGYGDGVYKSTDGGQTWKNMGLKDSGHISMIRFHPYDSNVVWVAAQGPLSGEQGRVVDQPRQLVETARHLDDAPRRLALMGGVVRHGGMDSGFAVAIADEQ